MIAEIEYCIGCHFWRMRYAREALNALITYINDTELKKLEAYHRSENRKSGRVLEKSLMHLTDNVQQFICENVVPEGEICYCIELDK